MLGKAEIRHDPNAREARRRPKPSGRPADLVERRRHDGLVVAPRRGQAQAAPGPDKQGLTEILFEHRQMPADRGLADAEFARRGRHAAEPGRRLELDQCRDRRQAGDRI
ncbi:MAG: hypothetical protein WDN69_16250 [Aliidongia sp.]